LVSARAGSQHHFTDGAKYLADAAGAAYWLLDEIALAQRFERNFSQADAAHF
jgi:hypothetical protein